MCVMGALLVLLIEVAGEGDESLTSKLLCVFSSNMWLELCGRASREGSGLTPVFGSPVQMENGLWESACC